MKDYSLENNLEIEKKLWSEGYKNIACVDEVGRGCFAGPLVCAAVIMPTDYRIDRLTDSKKINKKQHKFFEEKIKEVALDWNIVEISPEIIDEINIRQATLLGMKKAVEGLKNVDYVLIDGRDRIDITFPQETVIKGDYVCHGISAASLLAKVYRDELMKKLDEQYENVYGWSTNAGYPNLKHIESAKKYGITPYHRKTWATMKKLK